MRTIPWFLLRYFFECPCQKMRHLLAPPHCAYLRKHFPYQRYTLEWRKTWTMVASKVYRLDGTLEAIVTTFLLDGRILHEVERL